MHILCSNLVRGRKGFHIRSWKMKAFIFSTKHFLWIFSSIPWNSPSPFTRKISPRRACKFFPVSTSMANKSDERLHETPSKPFLKPEWKGKCVMSWKSEQIFRKSSFLNVLSIVFKLTGRHNSRFLKVIVQKKQCLRFIALNGRGSFFCSHLRFLEWKSLSKDNHSIIQNVSP